MYFYVHVMHVYNVGKRDALIVSMRVVCPHWRCLLFRQVLACQAGGYIYVRVYKYINMYVFLCTCNVCIHCGQTRRTYFMYACHMPVLKETATSAGPRMSSRRIHIYISIQIHKYVCISMYMWFIYALCANATYPLSICVLFAHTEDVYFLGKLLHVKRVNMYL